MFCSWGITESMAGGVCVHHPVILYILHFTVCSEKDAFEEGEQEISDIGTVPAQSEPRRHTGLSIGPFHLKKVLPYG